MKYPVAILVFLAAFAPAGLALAQIPSDAPSPAEQWTAHFTLRSVFPGNTAATAEEYCKTVAVGLMECQIYDSATPLARLVGVDVIASSTLFNRLDGSEQQTWTPLRDRLGPDAVLVVPSADVPSLDSLRTMYSKIFLLWDPTRTTIPLGAVPMMPTSTASGTGPELSTPAPAMNFQSGGGGSANAGQMFQPNSVQMTGARNLSRGSRGDDVRLLQQILIRLGFLASGLDTGFFGAATQNAVMSYQEANGLPATGVFGPLTRQSVMAASGGQMPMNSGAGSAGAGPGITQPVQPQPSPGAGPMQTPSPGGSSAGGTGGGASGGTGGGAGY